MASRWLISLGCLGAALVAVLIWAFGHSAPPASPSPTWPPQFARSRCWAKIPRALAARWSMSPASTA